MKMLKLIYFPLRFQACKCSTNVQMLKVKPTVTLDENTNELIKEKKLKPRKHDGRCHRVTIQLPTWTLKAMKILTTEYPRQALLEDSTNLNRYLNSKLPPPENDYVQSQYEETVEAVAKKMKSTEKIVSEDIPPEIHRKTLKILKKKIPSWASIQYDTYRSLLYMMARGATDYASLCTIMNEIQTRDPEFKPKTLLDFGSGVGTVSWAALEFWRNSLKERMCIDISTEINEVAEKLIQYADPEIKCTAFHRQYLPVASVPTFDIVVSAFSLLELPNRKMRMDTVANMWRKTEKYLVLVEYGTKGGFQVISEARDFLLHVINIRKKRDPSTRGFIFSPCPHDLECPMSIENDKKCMFEAKFMDFSFSNRMKPNKNYYTYVVFKKDAERKGEECWPRITSPVLVRSGHAICRMCTSAGKLQEIIFSKGKHERSLYRCARTSRWGDRLPIEITTTNEEG